VKQYRSSHGGFVDGAGWRASQLLRDGYNVSIVRSYDIAGRLVRPSEFLQPDDLPILVGHSYGGAVDHWKPETIQRFQGLCTSPRSLWTRASPWPRLLRIRRPVRRTPPILPPQDGYLFLDKAKFPASFAADVDADKAAFMADSQVPWGLAALSARSANQRGGPSRAGT